MNCPECGRFCGDITADYNEFAGITKVHGLCARHGRVDLTNEDWCYEDFFPEGDD